MSKLKLYSILLQLSSKNNHKLLRFFILDEMKTKLSKSQFYLTLFLSKQPQKNIVLYNFLEKYIQNNYQTIINRYLK
jgi:hypothetical protein